MKMFLQVIFLLFVFSTVAHANDTTKLTAYIKFHPLAALNDDRPTLLGSIEFHLNDKIGLGFGYGRRYIDAGIYAGSRIDSPAVKFSGETKFVELMLYDLIPINEIANAKTYIGLSFRHFNDIENRVDHYYPKTDSTNANSKADYYAVKRIVYVLGMKTGVFYELTKKISMEIYGEIGVRHKKQTLLEYEFDLDKDDVSFATFNPKSYNEPFNGYLPTLNVGVKFNYKLFSDVNLL